MASQKRIRERLLRNAETLREELELESCKSLKPRHCSKRPEKDDNPRPKYRATQQRGSRRR